jgi:hypothetical protein
MGSYYNSPKLARSLKKTYQTDCIRMLKLNRENVLKKLRDTKLKKEGVIAQHSGPVSVIKWSDKLM